MPRIRILLTLLLTISTAAVADFHIESSSNHRDVDAVGGVALRITVVNGTTAPASNVTLFYAAERASLGTLAPGESASFDVRVAFDQSYGRKYLPVSAQADIGGKTVSDFEYTPVARYRSFAVTQTGDAGAGSLRAAIDALNADSVCAALPCAIDFDLAPDSTIVLQSALPQITAHDVLVDVLGKGSVTLDGAAVRGNALDFNVAERATVDGLTIANFGDNAILLRTHRPQNFADPFQSFEVTNCVLRHNVRGINVTPGSSIWSSVIRDNLLADNARSAVFVDNDHNLGGPLVPAIRIERNRITGNGASGIYLGPGSDGALLVDNVIEHNHDFGLAVARGAINVRLLPNVIAHNGAAIDIGLDGPTPSLPEPTGDRSPAVIESARYDPATNTTTISGRPGVTPIGICDLCMTHIVSLYANDAPEHGEYAEAQTYLGEAQPNGAGFVFTFNGDLRDKYVTALVTLWVNGVGSDLFNTAELSKAVLIR